MTPTSAAGAYSAIAKLANQAQSEPATDKTAGSPDFGAMVRSAIGNVVTTGNAAEASAVGLAQGQGDIVNVVTAMAETEVALETMVSVRDKVISAYQEIMNMPI